MKKDWNFHMGRKTLKTPHRAKNPEDVAPAKAGVQWLLPE
jgi:hypothetical protein